MKEGLSAITIIAQRVQERMRTLHPYSKQNQAEKLHVLNVFNKLEFM